MDNLLVISTLDAAPRLPALTGRSVKHATRACDSCKYRKKRCTVNRCRACISGNVRECHHGPCDPCFKRGNGDLCQWSMPDRRDRQERNSRHNGRVVHSSLATPTLPQSAVGQDVRPYEHVHRDWPISVIHASLMPNSIPFDSMTLTANSVPVQVEHTAAPNAVAYPFMLGDHGGAIAPKDDDQLPMQDSMLDLSNPNLCEGSTDFGNQSARGSNFPYQARLKIQQLDSSDSSSASMGKEHVSQTALSISQSSWTASPQPLNPLLGTPRVQSGSNYYSVTPYASVNNNSEANLEADSFLHRTPTTGELNLSLISFPWIEATHVDGSRFYFGGPM